VQLVTKDYQGHAIAYQDDGWFNATQAAAKFGKRPNDWLALQSTKDYIEAFKRHNPDVKRTHFSKKGRFSDTGNSGITPEQGTWLHPRLAVVFARWLDADFAVWCDAQIDGLIRGKDDWRKLRHESASSFKMMQRVLEMIRTEDGKETKHYHYINEALRVNFVASGKREPIDREALDTKSLDLLAHLEEHNAILIGRGVDYKERKLLLQQYAQQHSKVFLGGVAA